MKFLKQRCIACDKEFEKITNVKKDFCIECKELKSKGFILVGAVEEKSINKSNPYRSGNIWVISHNAAKDLFEPRNLPQSGMAFIDVNTAVQIGLPNVNVDA